MEEKSGELHPKMGAVIPPIRDAFSQCDSSSPLVIDYVTLKNSYFETPTPNMIILGDRTFQEVNRIE